MMIFRPLRELTSSTNFCNYALNFPARATTAITFD
jgi:hypothetical protein